MSAGVFDIFTVGIGPSSSHTVGPMRAAGLLLGELGANQGGGGECAALGDVSSIQVELLGALGATGLGHGSHTAVLAGLEGAQPETVTPQFIAETYQHVRDTQTLALGGRVSGIQVPFDLNRDMVYSPQTRLDFHPNAVRFRMETARGPALTRTFFSIGGGFVVDGDRSSITTAAPDHRLPHPFTTGAQLLDACVCEGLSVAELMVRNEIARGRTRDQVRAGLVRLWKVMSECIDIGCHTEGLLPGPLAVRRRAAAMRRTLKHRGNTDPMAGLDWVSLWALAVNEQNAAGGVVVTAPTNGAAGIVPAVLKYAVDLLPRSDDSTVVDFLLAAGAVGAIYQATASISGAEVGCQGEIGVASSMAAAGLTQILGGSVQQVLNAAEIGMEHHLGLTCDPVGGLVQIPCIERNAVGATTAITAARLALAGDGRQIVSLDQVVATMMATGRDMASQYKETSQGGLALNIVVC